MKIDNFSNAPKECRTDGDVLAAQEMLDLAKIQRLRDSMPDKESLIDELIDLFLADLPGRLAAIADAVKRVDAPALALEAHALRSGSGNFGATRLDDLCGRMEQMGKSGVLDAVGAMLDELDLEAQRVHDALLAIKSLDA